MVYVNDQKYACESCIKGHRSSSCNHAERPLFEVKKKGRPVSQCQDCREARKTKSAHNKCSCAQMAVVRASTASSSSCAPPPAAKSKSRFKPIAPALPNGLKDVDAREFKVVVGPNARQSKDFIMYQPSLPSETPSPQAGSPKVLCLCGSVGECRCGPGQPCEGNHNTTSMARDGNLRGNGLSVLAQAAAICCGTDVFVVPSNLPTPTPQDPAAMSTNTFISTKQVRARDSPSPSLPPQQRKRAKHTEAYPPPSRSPSPLPLPSHMPVFPTIPSLSFATAVPEGCCCATDCACPGCTEHRGESYASAEHGDCDDDCDTCVDHASGIAMELPALHPTRSASSVDRYFSTVLREDAAQRDEDAEPVNSCCES